MDERNEVEDGTEGKKYTMIIDQETWLFNNKFALNHPFSIWGVKYDVSIQAIEREREMERERGRDVFVSKQMNHMTGNHKIIYQK